MSVVPHRDMITGNDPEQTSAEDFHAELIGRGTCEGNPAGLPECRFNRGAAAGRPCFGKW